MLCVYIPALAQLKTVLHVTYYIVNTHSIEICLIIQSTCTSQQFNLYRYNIMCLYTIV